ncbi:Vsp/OspC family lipoprotein (plasmid) [Borrelia puertoricensis]|uniref:Vsp/OspC family lipoprotein n=1 Tax=Borrelia puertoricensis TaxID=2756107 RepID=UPI003EB90B79
MKRITLCALFLTLFLLISCNTSGKNLTDDEVAKSDGTVIDLAKITKNIKDTVDFAKSVKEIHTLVKSIDTLAKAIGQKVNADGLTAEADKNDSLVAGIFQVISDVKDKLTKLETVASKFDGLKENVVAAKKGSDDFLTKVKAQHNNLGQSAEAPKAIKKGNADSTKGAKELGDLNTAIDALLKDAEAIVESAINALTNSAKP